MKRCSMDPFERLDALFDGFTEEKCEPLPQSVDSERPVLFSERANAKKVAKASMTEIRNVRKRALNRRDALEAQCAQLAQKVYRFGKAADQQRERQVELGKVLQELEWRLESAQDSFPEEISSTKRQRDSAVSKMRKLKLEEKTFRRNCDVSKQELRRLKDILRLRDDELEEAQRIYLNAQISHDEAKEHQSNDTASTAQKSTQ